jgi:acetoin utilization protein AcuB
MTHARKLSIHDYMTHKPLTAERSESVTSARSRLLKAGVVLLPVLEQGRLVGTLSLSDVALAEQLPEDGREGLTVDAFMQREFYAVGPEQPVDVAARAMAHHRHHAAVVVEGERPIGVFTTTDALRALSDSLTDSLPGEVFVD